MASALLDTQQTMTPVPVPTLPTLPTLPVLTARTRHYGRAAFRHPGITTRQRYAPYPSRYNAVPPSPMPSTFPGKFITLVNSVLSNSISETSTQARPQDNSRSLASGQLIQNAAATLIPAREVIQSEVLTPFNEDSGLIPKPLGEVGRGGTRGYNLEEELNWADGEGKKMKVCTF
jgi:hypothetical protein